GFDEPGDQPQMRQPAVAGATGNRPVQAAADLLKQVAKNLAPNDKRQSISEPSRQMPPQVLAEQKPVPAAAKAEAEELVKPAEPGVVAEVPEFEVRAYQVGRYLILNLAHPEIDAHREAALLASIAEACWGQASEFLYDLAWPVFSNPRLQGQDQSVAQAVLTRSLQEYLDGKEGLILFGQPPLWPIMTEGEIGRADQMLALPASLPVLTTWSLGEMLLAPHRKREVWLHLRRFPGAS